MNQKIKILALGLFILLGGLSMTSCNRGSGCPAETAQTKTNSKGTFSKKKGSSNLFPKNMRKN